MDEDLMNAMGENFRSIAYWKARNAPAAADETPEADVTRPVSQRESGE
jgi:predicted chitinase